jgi:hypothetical protein
MRPHIFANREYLQLSHSSPQPFVEHGYIRHPCSVKTIVGVGVGVCSFQVSNRLTSGKNHVAPPRQDRPVDVSHKLVLLFPSIS